MTPIEVAATLRRFNGWRRDFEDKLEQPDSREISEAIDAAIEMIERLESAEKERDNANAAAVNIALEAERLQCEIDNLLAKVETMEKQEPVAWIVRGGYPVPLNKLEWQLWCGSEKPTLSWVNQETRPLYALPGAKGEEK